MWEWDCRNENLAKGRKSRNTHIVIMHFWLLESRLSLGHWTIVCILLTWSQTSSSRWISYPSLHLPPQWFRVLKIWFLSKHFLTQISALLPYMHISNSSMVASFSSSTYFIFRYGIFRCTSVLATEAEADAVATEVEVEVGGGGCICGGRGGGIEFCHGKGDGGGEVGVWTKGGVGVGVGIGIVRKHCVVDTTNSFTIDCSGTICHLGCHTQSSCTFMIAVVS